VLIDLAASRAKASSCCLSILPILSHCWLNNRQLHSFIYSLVGFDIEDTLLETVILKRFKTHKAVSPD
ncbi:hypothetical protein, partial [Pontibacterium sp.]|uniref:hypothetical protein n=1 Tax=Pontibacterium sp. TaxID=2036026 RepID=UPI003561AC10